MRDWSSANRIQGSGKPICERNHGLLLQTDTIQKAKQLVRVISGTGLQISVLSHIVT